jgi:hypothetical protein
LYIYAILNGYFTDEHGRKAVSWSSTLQIFVCLNWNVMEFIVSIVWSNPRLLTQISFMSKEEFVSRTTTG